MYVLTTPTLHFARGASLTRSDQFGHFPKSDQCHFSRSDQKVTVGFQIADLRADVLGNGAEGADRARGTKEPGTVGRLGGYRLP